MNDYHWLKRCVKVARDLKQRHTFGQIYRQYRKEGRTVVSASTGAVFICNAMARTNATTS